MVSIRVYVEGGGDTQTVRTKCREGFSKFFQESGLEGRMPRVVACGTRHDAYDRFCTALEQARPNDFPILLVDSEAPIAVGTSPWEHLKNREGDNWDRPRAAADEHAHLMVQCMEAWFLADQESLTRFFGQGFSAGALPSRTDIENISKDDLYRGLADATRLCPTKGEYRKGKQSFEILALISPQMVCQASPFANRLVQTLLQKA